MRHGLSGLFKDIKADLIISRRSESDIGKKSAQNVYGGVEDIISANFSRVQESLRVLEECSRILFPEKVQKIKKLRFESYSLEKKIMSKYVRKSKD